jgi:hypothetical protein
MKRYLGTILFRYTLSLILTVWTLISCSRGVKHPLSKNGRLRGSAEERGRNVFLKAGCKQCHTGTHWAISNLPLPPYTDGHKIASVLRNVGSATLKDLFGQHGFNMPTLLGLG